MPAENKSRYYNFSKHSILLFVINGYQTVDAIIHIFPLASYHVCIYTEDKDEFYIKIQQVKALPSSLLSFAWARSKKNCTVFSILQQVCCMENIVQWLANTA